MAIRLLPNDIAAKIAAGEVIERPSSVVKELLENSIDAGASDIRVETREGGVRLIRVVDNGCGIPGTEAELAFQRHATSKLQTADDLERITTLGFRGEALASIAAVSQVTLLTRTASEEVGTRLRLEAGEIVARDGQGCPIGTSLTVENLFYNVPARRKFLRSEATESAQIFNLVTRYALAWPDLRFSLIRDGRLVFQSTGSSDMHDVILKLYDLQTVRELIEFHGQEHGVKAWGYTSLPSLHRADRNHLSVFVNRRLVQDRFITRALIDAYHGLLPTGRYPMTILQVQIEPSKVDVNVHPAKAEVRFRHSGDVFNAVQKAIRAALSNASPIRPLAPLSTLTPIGRSQQTTLWSHPLPSDWSRLALEIQRTPEAVDLATIGDSWHAESSAPSRNLPPLRVLGQLSQTYIIAEGPAGLYLIDQHTAHERVLYERFRAERAKEGIVRQALLTPLAVDLTALQTATLIEHLETVSALGFEIEPFGMQTLLVRAVPAALAPEAIAGTLSEMADRMATGSSSSDLFEQGLLTLVCHSAVRAGKPLTHEEMRDLLRQLELTALPHTCPHGRPIFLHLSTDRLAHAFGR